MDLSARRALWLCAAALFSANTLAQVTAPAQPAESAASPNPAANVPARQRQAAEAAYMRGAKHLAAGQFPQAEQEFARATASDPSHPEYLQALLLAREHHVTDLLQQAAQKRPLNPAAAAQLLDQARKLDSSNPRVQQHSMQATQPSAPRMQLAGAISLAPNSSKHSYHMRTDLRALAAQMGTDYGVRFVLDPELAPKQFRIDIDDVAFEEAVRALNLLTDTMSSPLDPHMLVIAADTTPNRQRYERLVEQTYLLPGLTPDQIKDYVSIAQNIFELKQVSLQPSLNAIVMRGPADLVGGANRVFADLLQGDSDVVVDLKLYEVNKQTTRNVGVVLPQSLNGLSLASQAQSIVSQNQTLISQLIASGVIPSTASVYEIAAYLVFSGGLGSSSSLLTNSFLVFGGGATTGVLSAGNIPMVNLALNNSDARTLDDVQLRASDRQTTTFKSGTRYPIQTSLFSDIASSTTSALAGTTVNGVSLSSLLASYLGTSSVGSSAVIPQIQYEDLGLVLAATPRILRTGDVGMHLDIKISALAGTALNGIPVLSSRQFTSDLTLHDGQTAMMVSNTTRSETAAVTGAPGLSEIPGFQSTTDRNTNVTTGDLVLMITPHIVHLGHTSAKGPYIPLQPRPDDD
jgi:general secretion pathway protein D